MEEPVGITTIPCLKTVHRKLNEIKMGFELSQGKKVTWDMFFEEVVRRWQSK